MLTNKKSFTNNYIHGQKKNHSQMLSPYLLHVFRTISSSISFQHIRDSFHWLLPFRNWCLTLNIRNSRIWKSVEIFAINISCDCALYILSKNRRIFESFSRIRFSTSGDSCNYRKTVFRSFVELACNFVCSDFGLTMDSSKVSSLSHQY